GRARPLSVPVVRRGSRGGVAARGAGGAPPGRRAGVPRARAPGRPREALPVPARRDGLLPGVPRPPPALRSVVARSAPRAGRRLPGRADGRGRGPERTARGRADPGLAQRPGGIVIVCVSPRRTI